MGSAVTDPTEGDQICFVVISRLTSKLQMMHLKVLHRSTHLATPAISLKNLEMKFAVAFGRKA